ncbi:MAG: hypothetical protein M5U33_07440 [Pseudorhodoplanes sp.]|nr:hypothetical protein [Pseudorhodoplanes sp.]
MRLLRAQVEGGRRAAQRFHRTDALVDIGHAEALRHARERGEMGVEAMLDAQMPGAVGLRFLERISRHVPDGGARRIDVEGVARVHARLLDAPARRDVGAGQDRDGLLPVERARGLVEPEMMDRGGAELLRPLRIVVGAVIVVTADRLPGDRAERRIELQARREGRRRQRRLDRGARVGGGRGLRRTEILRVFLLVAHAAVDDELGAGRQHARETAGDVLTFLFGEVVGRERAPPVGDQAELPLARRIAPVTGKADALVVGRQVQIEAALIGGVADVGGAVVLAVCAVDAIAVRIDGVAEHGRGPAAVRAEPGQVAFLVVERAEGAVDAAFGGLTGPALGDDVDHATDRAVAIEHDAAVAARDLDALDALARDRGEIETDHVEVVDPAAVDQKQRVGRRRRAEAAHVDGSARAIDAAEQRLHLDAGLARQDLRAGSAPASARYPPP